ncbi:MAG: hypothetical protein H6779_01130 [Candidatus Nomurabacteria bacterium]|nr:hypothetical protein [Candidatus Nomurabacteria bacterium]USN88032.1 MAG: hypothetical protein H6779_01130 [Candidatus Nomurabacteria bacterium]
MSFNSSFIFIIIICIIYGLSQNPDYLKSIPKEEQVFDLNFEWYWKIVPTQDLSWAWFIDWLTPKTKTEPMDPSIRKVIAPAKGSPVYTILKTKQYLSEVGIMHEISRCESERKHRDGSGKLLPNNTGSSARGAFQVLFGVHKEEMVKLGLNPYNDDHYFTFVRRLYDARGTQPWYASEQCWGNITIKKT